MEKIKALLQKIGASKELTESIVTELERFGKETRERHEKDFKARIEAAKKICAEEVQSYKLELGRKLAVYLESKQAQMARAVEKQLALEGTEAADRLVRIKALLEGVKVDAAPLAEDVKKLQEKVTALEGANARLAEERNVAVTKARRATNIANEVLAANRKLEEASKTKVAPATPAPAAPVLEGAAPTKPVVTEEKPAAGPATLEALRTAPAAPVTPPTKPARKSDVEKIAETV